MWTAIYKSQSCGLPIKAFVVVDGEGEVETPGGSQHIRAGYTWLLKQQAPLRISGHCSVLIVNL